MFVSSDETRIFTSPVIKLGPAQSLSSPVTPDSTKQQSKQRVRPFPFFLWHPFEWTTCSVLLSVKSHTRTFTAQESLRLRVNSTPPWLLNSSCVASSLWRPSSVCECPLPQHMEIVTLIPRLPLSANKCAMEVSNTRQSLFMMAAATPSWMERGVASQVSRRRLPLSSRR